MKSLLFLITGLIFSVCCRAQDYSQFQYASYEHDSYLLNYRILYPEHMDSTVRYPVMVFLHGAFERGSDNNLQLANGAGLFLREENRRQFPSIVIFPQCPQNEVWAWFDTDIDSATGLAKKWYFPFRKNPTDVTATLKALLDSIILLPYADRDRIYIGGLSQGGMGVFDLVARYPDFFAAGFPICGAGNISTARYFAGKVPMWIFHGTEDKIVPVRFSRDYYRRLKKAGSEVKYTEYPGVGHASWVRALAEKDLLPWIYAQSKTSVK
jgi:predicted peptidase